MSKAADPSAMPKFTLRVIGSDEDLPRRVEAYGKHPVIGQVALVLGLGSILACVSPEGVAKAWRGDGWASPGTPSSATSVEEIVAGIKAAKAQTPSKGAKTLKGSWKGYLTCEGGLMGHLPVVVLSRKIASYGTLHIEGRVNGWTYRFEREERWFTKPGSVTGNDPLSSFPVAIQRGLAAAMGLVQEACGVQHTRQRRDIDPAYAAQHPRPERAPRPDVPFDTKLKPPKPAKAPKPPKEAKAPKAPKAPSTRPLTPYMQFAIPRTKALREQGMSQKEAMIQAGNEWRATHPATDAKAPRPPKEAEAAKAPKEPKAAEPKAPKGKKAAGPAVDPEKDKILIAGFGSAIRDALNLGA